MAEQHDRDDDLLEAHEHKGYGDDEGEREESLEEPDDGADAQEEADPQ